MVKIAKLRILYHFLKSRYGRRFTNRQQLQSYQDKMLKKHFKYIQKNSPYYQEHGFDEVEYMDKQFMMDHFDQLNTVDIRKNQAFEIALESERTRDFSPMIGEISVGLSSGTSGHRGIFLTSREERDKWAGVILGKLLPKGNLFNHRIAFFMRANNQLYDTIDSKVVDFQFYDMYRPMEELMAELINQQPTIVVAPASVLLNIATFLEEQIQSIQPIKVISVAEVLEERDAKYIKDILNQEHIHQIYQCTEGFLGCTCEHGTIHLNEDILHIESYWLDESRFHPIITDFNRRSQPIIRYLLNDILIKKEVSCPCGSPLIAIEAIEGRADDVFEFDSCHSDQDKVKVYPDFIRRCMLYIDDILNYRVIQKVDQSINIQYEGSPEQQALIIQQFQRLADQLAFKLPKIRFTPYEQPTHTKLKRVIKEKSL
ncbi:F390 synthetase-related protein [Aerococcaceae bacterium WGS1372]